jgi:hypothetical protein
MFLGLRSWSSSWQKRSHSQLALSASPLWPFKSAIAFVSQSSSGIPFRVGLRNSAGCRCNCGYLPTIWSSFSTSIVLGFQEQLVKNALTMMKKDIDKLASVISDLSRRVSSAQNGLRRQWGRGQVALKEGRISRFRGHVESAISVLTLLQTGRSQ